MHKAAALALLLLLSGCLGSDGPRGDGTATDPGRLDGAANGTAPPLERLPWTWTETGRGLEAVGGSGVPFGLAESALATREGVAYLVGGFTDAGGGSPIALAHELEGPTNGAIVPYPLPVHHAQAVVVGPYLYVFGGYVTGAPLPGSLTGVGPAGWPQTPLAFRISAVNTVGDPGAWEPIAPLPASRAAGAAAEIDGLVYLVGGYGLDGFTPEVLRYDPAQDAYTAVAPLPTPRDHLNLLAHGGLLYAVAGRVNEGGSWNDLETLESYDPVADAWTSLPPVPLGRGGQAAAFFGDWLVVAGGERAEGSFAVYDEVHAYDVGNATWAEVAPMPEPRHGGALAAGEAGLYYLGGAREDGSLASEDLLMAVAAPSNATAAEAESASTTA